MKKTFAPFSRANKSINFKTQSVRERNFRTYLIPIGFLLVLLVFATRLVHLTIVKGTYYQFAAENNRIRELYIEGERGTIFDRKGHKLAYTTEIESDNQGEISTYKRIYNDGDYFAHMLGYRQIASDTNFEQDACSEPLRLNDKVGAKGAEELFECHLRAQKGKQLIEVDSQGNYTKTLTKVDPKKGQDLVLSLDSELQETAYKLIHEGDIQTDVEIDYSEKKIAVVGLDPRTGEVLVLLSYPSFNPQVFEDGNSEETAKYLTDDNKPLFNRALLGTYPPGSVFKPIVAAGALEEGVIEPTDTITDNGYVDVGPARFHNWLYTQYGRTDGEVDLVKGLQRSNDIYFYKIGERLNAERIKDWAEHFGLGKHTGIALDDATGSIPSDFWKRENIGERWFLGDTFNMSIGQGYVLTTPMQIALSTLPFANGGKICTPQILKLSAHENKDLLEDSYGGTEPQCWSLDLSQETLSSIREGMKQACEPGGTAWPFFNWKANESDIPVGCKTGTAESLSKDHAPHAWFTIFAPYEDPEIVLTVMVEESGEGSSVAAPIARDVLKYYFERTE